MAMQEDIERVM